MLIKRPENYSYRELWTPRGNKFDYPKKCPCCGAKGHEVKGSFYHKFAYECGGEWEWKSQIQNHTDKVYGKCGLDKKYEEQENVVMFAIFYDSFCNWTVFKHIEGVNSVKEHVIYKMKNFWSAPSDYKREYIKWVEENFDKYFDIVKEICKSDIDVRLICGFNKDMSPFYITDWKEIAHRINVVGFNEYGQLQFYKFGKRINVIIG